MNSNMTEKQMVIKAKKGDRDCMQALYDLNIRMIMKFAISTANSLRPHDYVEFIEDFKQNAFIYMHRAVKYCKPSIIKKDDKWRFGYIFYYYLLILKKNTLKHRIKSTSISIEAVENSHSHSSISAETDYMLKYCEKEFIRRLTERQKKILSLRSIGLTMKEISEEVEISFPSVHRDIKIAKRIASSTFLVNYK